MALNAIADGVLIVDEHGIVKFANPAAATLTGYGSPASMVGLDYQLLIRLQTGEQADVPIQQSPLALALQTNHAVTTREFLLVAAQSEKRCAIALSVTPTGGIHDDRIITFRDITKELAEENEQSEFISTASHEMRTPVASIEGYLGLALNPQTATIDDRAKQYLEAAHAASQHLGHLFKDLLDVTQIDDGRSRLHPVPVDIVAAVRELADAHEKEMQAKHLKYSFGTATPVTEKRKIDQLVYASVDLDFLREIMDNLIENAIKYTPEGGEIWVNARGDGDKVLINVTDTGLGIAADDLAHIFQKFYRVDNSQTRQIGGTGLGLYLVKQRAEAMDGRVWAESAFGDGSTFFVSLPRLSPDEYNKHLLAYQNNQMVQSFAQPTAPTRPVQSSQPTQLVQQPQPARPVNSGQSTQSIQPAQATQPAQPITAPAPAQPTPVAAQSLAPASPNQSLNNIPNQENL